MTGADQKIEHRVLHLAMVRARKVKAVSANVGLIAELEGRDIIVTMPETIFMVAYRMRDDVPELAAHFVQDDEHGNSGPSSSLARGEWPTTRRESSAGSSERPASPERADLYSDCDPRWCTP